MTSLTITMGAPVVTQAAAGLATAWAMGNAASTSSALTGYFIAPSGSDSTGNGSIGSPWATIQKWIDHSPAAGETLYIRGGTYSSHATSIAGHGGKPGLLGTASAPITIRNYPSETPVFSGGSDPLLGIAGDSNPSAYVVIDGIQVTGRLMGASGAIYVGAWASADPNVYNVEHVTIRNYKFTMAYGDTDNTSHGLYVSKCARYVTIEDSLFIGPGATTGGDGITVGSGSGLHPDDVTIKRCIFANFNKGGLSVWHDNTDAGQMDVLISHCSFIDNTNLGAMRIERHGSTTVRDCASTDVYVAPGSGNGNPWIYHGYYTISDVTQTNNYFSQTFDASYYLAAGQSGRGAGTDGNDAGALDW
jgi:hypothetical protein